MLKLYDIVCLHYEKVQYLYVDKISGAKWEKNVICPTIGDEFETPAYHLSEFLPQNYNNKDWNGWYTMSDDDGPLPENALAIYLDNSEEGHCLWCGGDGILTYSIIE